MRPQNWVKYEPKIDWKRRRLHLTHSSIVLLAQHKTAHWLSWTDSPPRLFLLISHPVLSSRTKIDSLWLFSPVFFYRYWQRLAKPKRNSQNAINKLIASTNWFNYKIKQIFCFESIWSICINWLLFYFNNFVAISNWEHRYILIGEFIETNHQHVMNFISGDCPIKRRIFSFGRSCYVGCSWFLMCSPKNKKKTDSNRQYKFQHFIAVIENLIIVRRWITGFFILFEFCQLNVDCLNNYTRMILKCFFWFGYLHNGWDDEMMRRQEEKKCMRRCLVKLWLNAIKRNCYNLSFQPIFVHRVIFARKKSLSAKTRDEYTYRRWIPENKFLFCFYGNWIDRSRWCDDDDLVASYSAH